jgi:hypothetical protein
MAQVGLGQHIWTLSAWQTEQYFKVRAHLHAHDDRNLLLPMYADDRPKQRLYYAIILYYCALGSIKIALLLQYRRTFGTRLRRAINVALLIIGPWSVGLVMLSIFTCSPIRGYWRKNTRATCIPPFQWYIHSAGNILSDIVIFTLPIPLLWSMKVSAKQRLLLILLFSLGLL